MQAASTCHCDSSRLALIAAMLILCLLTGCEKKTAQAGTRTICSSCSQVISENVHVVEVGLMTNANKVKVKVTYSLCDTCAAREAAASLVRQQRAEADHAAQEAKELAYQNELVSIRHVLICEQCRKEYDSTTEMVRRRDASRKSEVRTTSGFCSRACETQFNMNRRLRKTGEVIGEAGKSVIEGLREGTK